MLVLAGAGALGPALASQESAPQPPPVTDAAPRSEPEPSPTDTPSSEPSAEPEPEPTGMSRSAAVRVRAPSVDIDSVVNETGLNAEGEIQVPQHGPQYDEAAWFTGSPSPGELGPSVLLGHVDSVSTGPSVFFELGGIAEGDEVTVTRADGEDVTFEVYRIDRYAKNAFPTASVYGNTEGPELRLITCGGDINEGTGHYEDNVVVYAKVVQAA